MVLVKLRGLIPFDKGKFPQRDASRRTPFLGGAAPQVVNPDYRVDQDDYLEFTMTSADGSGLALPIDVDMDGLLDSLALLKGIRCPRLPVWMLSDSTNIIFSDSARSTIRVAIDFSSIQPCETPWRDIFDLVTSAVSQSTLGNNRFVVNLHPGETVRAHRGDTLILRRTARTRAPASTGDWKALARDVSETHELAVDQWGYMEIPPLKRMSALPRDGILLSESYFRGVDAGLEAGHFRIRVWAPDWSPVDQMSLGQISALLSMGEPSKKTPPAWKARAARANTDREAIRPDLESYELVRYSLRAGNRLWTLVDESGYRHSFTYRPGISVASAVSSTYAGMQGRNFLESNNSIYVTVVPDQWRSLEPPFWGMCTDGRPSPIDDAMLLPGDTVLVTSKQPQAEN